MQSPGRVREDDVDVAPRARLVHRLVTHRPRFGVRRRVAHHRSRAFSPRRELFGRRRAKRVSRHHHHLRPALRESMTQFSQRRRLPPPVHAHHQHHARFARRLVQSNLHRVPRLGQHLHDRRLQRSPHVPPRLTLASLHARAHAVRHPRRRPPRRRRRSTRRSNRPRKSDDRAIVRRPRDATRS